jgi:hypothetical protein
MLAPLIFTDDKLTKLFSMFLSLYIVIVKVVISFCGPAVLEGSFLER